MRIRSSKEKNKSKKIEDVMNVCTAKMMKIKAKRKKKYHTIHTFGDYWLQGEV